jgi:hypothetical protein
VDEEARHTVDYLAGYAPRRASDDRFAFPHAFRDREAETSLSDFCRMTRPWFAGR